MNEKIERMIIETRDLMKNLKEFIDCDIINDDYSNPQTVKNRLSEEAWNELDGLEVWWQELHNAIYDAQRCKMKADILDNDKKLKETTGGSSAGERIIHE